MQEFVQIYDTTLRDGAQAEGVSLQVMDKLRIARKLDELGVHYIEGGWPGSNPKDILFFEEIKKFPFDRLKLPLSAAHAVLILRRIKIPIWLP